MDWVGAQADQMKKSPLTGHDLKNHLPLSPAPMGFNTRKNWGPLASQVILAGRKLSLAHFKDPSPSLKLCSRF
jgi:hypothetical protein